VPTSKVRTEVDALEERARSRLDLEPARVHIARIEDLDRDTLAEGLVRGGHDDTHPSLAEDVLDAILPVEHVARSDTGAGRRFFYVHQE